MATILVEGVSKRYGKHHVLDNFSLRIEHGECFTLLGPSGCGKTVLLRLIAGFETPDSGAIRIGGTVAAKPDSGIHLPPERRGLGVVFQDYAVWPHLSVFDNVAYPLKLAGLPKQAVRDRVLESVALVNMAGLENRLPSELSGGQQQRVALARALVARPALLLLDEPLSNLDANLREEMRFEIKELQRKLDITVLYVTHDQEIALALSDRLAILDENGILRQTGTPPEIFERPADLFVFTFMGVANLLPARGEGNVCLVGRRTLPFQPGVCPDGARGLVGFRPSDVRIDRENGGDASCLRGTVRRASFLGPVMDYLVDVDGNTLRVSVDTHEALDRGRMFREGDSCALRFHNLLWFDAPDAANAPPAKKSLRADLAPTQGAGT
ncbi:MAG: ABC transporter ATP-binding protein [Desulfovibrio sp.]|jgi:iron(III) transport system ATP-binding protein|nr:ABC transporter ATP-binding protein [Desulfovibrio sp.]